MTPAPGSPALSGRRWTATDAARLRWRHWDGEHVLFDPSTGDTHLFDALAGDLLRLLCAASRTEQELLEHLESAHSGQAADPPVDYVRQLLVQLSGAGLIVCVSE